MNNAHAFTQVVRLPGGRLFALTQVTKDKEQHQAVLLSENDGRDWKDITNPAWTNIPCCRLSAIRTTRRPGICVYSANTLRHWRRFLRQAADDQFRWKSVYASLRADYEWPPDEKKTEEEFFYHWYYVGYSVSWPLARSAVAGRIPREYV